MKILVVKPQQYPYVLEIPHQLSKMQELVGGCIQAVYPFEEAVALVCNEEGKMLGLPLNRALFDPQTHQIYDIIAGTFFLCAAPPDSDSFESLTEDQIKQYSKRFGMLEFYLGGI